MLFTGDWVDNPRRRLKLCVSSAHWSDDFQMDILVEVPARSGRVWIWLAEAGTG